MPPTSKGPKPITPSEKSPASPAADGKARLEPGKAIITDKTGATLYETDDPGAPKVTRVHAILRPKDTEAYALVPGTIDGADRARGYLHTVGGRTFSLDVTGPAQPNPSSRGVAFSKPGETGPAFKRAYIDLRIITDRAGDVAVYVPSLDKPLFIPKDTQSMFAQEIREYIASIPD